MPQVGFVEPIIANFHFLASTSQNNWILNDFQFKSLWIKMIHQSQAIWKRFCLKFRPIAEDNQVHAINLSLFQLISRYKANWLLKVRILKVIGRKGVLWNCYNFCRTSYKPGGPKSFRSVVQNSFRISFDVKILISCYRDFREWRVMLILSWSYGEFLSILFAEFQWK